MISDVRQGVLDVDKTCELFDDTNDDDDKPLFGVGPQNRKDSSGDVGDVSWFGLLAANSPTYVHVCLPILYRNHLPVRRPPQLQKWLVQEMPGRTLIEGFLCSYRPSSLTFLSASYKPTLLGVFGEISGKFTYLYRLLACMCM